MQIAIELFEFLQMRLIAEYSLCPTMQEMADHVGLAQPSSVVRHLDRLEGWDLIQRTPRVPRSTSLTDKGRATSPTQLRACFCPEKPPRSP